jgi:PAS domain S-box-containing protein
MTLDDSNGLAGTRSDVAQRAGAHSERATQFCRVSAAGDSSYDVHPGTRRAAAPFRVDAVGGDRAAALRKGLAIETTFQHRLDELRHELSALQRLAHQDPVRVKELFPQAVADLRRSLAELESVAADLPWSDRPASDATARGNGKHAAAKRPERTEGGARSASEGLRHPPSARRMALLYAVSRVLSRSTRFEEAAPRVLRILCEGLGWDAGELWLVDASERTPPRVVFWPACSAVSAVHARPAHASAPPRPDDALDRDALDRPLERDAASARDGAPGMFRVPVPMQGRTRAILRVFCAHGRTPSVAVVECMTSIGVELGHFLERARDVEQLRESEARMSAILDAALDAAITIDDQGHVIEFNSAAAATFGRHRADVLGRALVDLFVPVRVRALALAAFDRFRATGNGRWLGERFETLALKADGTEFPVEVSLVAVETGDRPLLTIHAHDISSRKCAKHEAQLSQERLRSLMADLLLAEERERRRLAVDLHDGLSQTIALTQIKVAALRASLDGKLTNALDEIEELIDQTNQAARSISFELSPPVLHDLGLQPALQWLVENIQSRYGIAIALEDDGAPTPTDEKTRVILFRSIRELLINAAKHAGARRVRLRLRRRAGQWRASVEDDGVGMDPNVGQVRGSGLISIHERLSHVGGSMHIASAPGRGTTIDLCVPLRSGRAQEAEVEA